MSVYSRPSIQYQDGMELRGRKMTKDCTQPLRIGTVRALNGCAGIKSVTLAIRSCKRQDSTAYNFGPKSIIIQNINQILHLVWK